MAKGFGIASLVLAILSAFAFYGFNFAAIWLSMILCTVAILNGERGLSIASVLIAAAGLLIFSPITLAAILNDARQGHSAALLIGFLPFAFPIPALVIDVARRRPVSKAAPSQTAMAASMNAGVRAAEPSRVRTGPIVTVVALVAAVAGGFFLYQNDRMRRAIDVLIGEDHATAPGTAAAPAPAPVAAVEPSPSVEHPEPAASPSDVRATEAAKPSEKPTAGHRTDTAHIRVSTYRRGSPMTVRNFLADDDVVTLHEMRDSAVVSYSLGSIPSDALYNVERPSKPSVPTSIERGYEIIYDLEQHSFSVFIYKSPAGDYRRAMMADLAKRLGISRSRLCNVLMIVWVTRYADPAFSGRDVGLYRCGGATVLAGDPEFNRTADATGLAGPRRTEFVTASIYSCTVTAEQRNPNLGHEILVRYCTCYSNRLADLISPAYADSLAPFVNDVPRVQAALQSRAQVAIQACRSLLANK